MSVRYVGVADILIPRGKLAAVALKKQRGCIRGLLDCFAHGAHVIGRNRLVFPGESRRVTRIIHKRAACLSGRIRNSADEQGIVWIAVGIVAADESASFSI